MDLLVQEGSMIYHGDNLEVMRGMSGDSVDLVYLDPPFNTGKDWGEFDDRWSMDDYLGFMRERLEELRRLLKSTGSLYLHCDPRSSHYLKVLLDGIFGVKFFRRELVWQMKSRSGFKSRAANWVRDHDTIFYYSKPSSIVFNSQYEPYSEEYIRKMFKGKDEDGRRYRERANRRYYADEPGIPYGDVWTDINSFQTATRSSEYLGYPTQKPVALLERIIKASSNEGDVVLDPFCGSGTTLVAAKRLGRRWIGIDMNARAVELSRGRVEDVGGVTEYQKNLVDVSD